MAAVKADQAATGATAPKSEESSERVFTQEEFRAQLDSIDKSLRALPATAQACTVHMCNCRSLLVRELLHHLVYCHTPSKPVAIRMQVANQQGRYLAKVFNMHRVGQQPDSASRNGLPAAVPPFQYRHLGSFAYVGADQAVLELAMQGGCSGFVFRNRLLR